MSRPFRIAVPASLLVILAACTDDSSIIEPGPALDPGITAILVPGVDDAASRLQVGIIDDDVAAQIGIHLDRLFTDLTLNEGRRAGEHVVPAAELLATYAARGLGADGPDVTAIRLMLVHTAIRIGKPLDAAVIP